MTKIACILTSYNKGEWVGKAIQSVLDQDFEDWVLFIADDNSNEKTREVIKSFSDPRIILYQSNVAEEERYKICRYAYLINIGINSTNSDYITYITDDVIYYEDRFSTFSQFLDNNPDKHVCYGEQGVCSIDKNGQKIRLEGNHFNQDTFTPSGYIDHSSVMHRRSILKETGLWPTGPEVWACADSWFFHYVIKAGYKFYFVPGVYEEQYRLPTSLRVEKERRTGLYKIPWELERLPYENPSNGS